MIKVKNPSACCGCTACASICAHNAIQMKPDALGFLYPEVDTSKCTDCGLCNKVCQFHTNYDKSHNLPHPVAYGARHHNMREVETSRSGAAFIAISDWILDRGGVVYGAGYTDHFRVVHKRATTRSERDEFKGSKYVQSDISGIFSLIKQDLKNGLDVLFSGTPCQTAGLRAYLGPNLQNRLYLVDIICHGVPGPNLWRDYIALIEAKEGTKITNVNFRDKQNFGWKAHYETFHFGDRFITTNNYTKAFYQHIMLRQSCGTCPYTNIKRPSDITLADFWGWERCNPKANVDDKGLSLLLVNSKKGEELFGNAITELKTFPVNINDCIQPNMQHPSVIHPKRVKFEQDYLQKGLEYVFSDLERYNRPSLTRKIYRKFKRIIRNLLK